jgi:hypothetical protein
MGVRGGSERNMDRTILEASAEPIFSYEKLTGRKEVVTDIAYLDERRISWFSSDLEIRTRKSEDYCFIDGKRVTIFKHTNSGGGGYP